VIFSPAADSIDDLLSAAKSHAYLSVNDVKAVSMLDEMHLTMRYGRRRMQAHYALAVILSRRQWTISKTARLAIGILTIMSGRFRKLLIRRTGKSGQSLSSAIILSIILGFNDRSVTIHTNCAENELRDESDCSSNETESEAEDSNGVSDETDVSPSVKSRSQADLGASSDQDGISHDKGGGQEEINVTDEKEDKTQKVGGVAAKQNVEIRDDVRFNEATDKPSTEKATVPSATPQESIQDEASSLQKSPLVPENEITQPFDFATVFPYLPLPQVAETLSFTDHGSDIVLAALEASNKCAYFSKPLDSSDLISLIQRMSDVVCVQRDLRRHSRMSQMIMMET